MKTFLAAFVAVVLAGLAAPSQAAPPLVASAYTYELTRGMLTLGEAQFKLQPSGGENCWSYGYDARPQGVASLFIGRLTEHSSFCVVDDAIRSSKFEFHRSDRAKDDFSLEFDWTANVVRTSKGEIRQLTPGTTDRLAMQLVVQRWVIGREGKVGPEELSVTKVERRKLKIYRFRIIARETIEVPAGKFETVRVERIDNPDKAVRFWLAPSLGYNAVRVEELEDGDEQFAMVLKS